MVIDQIYLSKPSQLILRNLDRLRGTQVLIYGYPPDDFCRLVMQRLTHAEVTAFTFDYVAHQYSKESLQAAGLDPANQVFSAFYQPTSTIHDAAIVFLPKGRSATQMALQMVSSRLCPDATVYLAGENSAGIRASRALLEEVVGPVEGYEVARHCVLYWARLVKNPPSFSPDKWAIQFQVNYRDKSILAASFPGVFSHGKLDDGTRLLIENLDLSPEATILDFGCGAGLIGAAVQRDHPESRVDFVDNNAIALEATCRTLALNNLSARWIKPSNIFSDVHDTYTYILSNPPFHTGARMDYQVVERFLSEAIEHLEPRGSLIFVVNRFLKYHSLLKKHAGEYQVVASNQLFRVYECRRS